MAHPPVNAGAFANGSDVSVPPGLFVPFPPPPGLGLATRRRGLRFTISKSDGVIPAAERQSDRATTAALPSPTAQVLNAFTGQPVATAEKGNPLTSFTITLQPQETRRLLLRPAAP